MNHLVGFETLDHASQKLVVNFSSTATSGIITSSDFVSASNTSQRARISSLELCHAVIPHTWPIMNAAMENNAFLLTVYVGVVPANFLVTIQTTSINGPSTPVSLAALLAASLNTETVGIGVTWSVTYDAATLKLTISVTSGNATFVFRKDTTGPNNKSINRALYTIGFYQHAVQNPSLAQSAISTTGSIVDLNPIKSVIISVEGAPHGAETNAWATFGTFVVPVNTNHGFFSLYDAGISFPNIVYFNDHSFNTVNMRLRLLDITGNLLPLNGGTPELILDVVTRNMKRARH